MVSTAYTSGSSPIPSMASDHCTVHIECDGSFIFTYYSLQTMGLGAGSSNSPFQGSMGGTSTPYNAFPYDKSHIPPSSPSLGGSPQQPVEPNMNYSLLRAGSLGPYSYTTLVGSMSFSLFDAFGNNSFSSTTIPARGKLGFGPQNPVQGTIPTHGENTRVFSSQGLWNPWQGVVPSLGMSSEGNPFHGQWNPRQGLVPMPIGSVGGNPF
jgi:hypothetical protein